MRHIVFKTKTCGPHYRMCNKIGARKWSHAYLGGANPNTTMLCKQKHMSNV